MEAYWARSEFERAWHEKLWLARRGRCEHCGRQRSECSDPEKLWYPQREVCYATMERMAADAAYARLHQKSPWHDGSFQDWSTDPSEGFPYRHDFGVSFGVADTDLRPDDQFLRARDDVDDEEVDDGDSP